MIIGTYEKPAPKNPKAYMSFHLDKIGNELDTMIGEENKLHYELTNHDSHIFRLLSNQLIYNFRISIGLEMTEEIAKSYKTDSQIEQLKKDAEYKNNGLPYFVASNRATLSNDFYTEQDAFLNDKNSLIKVNLLTKMMNQVGEHDPHLKKKKQENLESKTKL